MSDQPEEIETTPKVGKHGGEEVFNAPPPPTTEQVPVDPVVGKEGGENLWRHER